MKTPSLLALAALFICPAAFSGAYETLPKGVNTLVLAQIQSNKIQSKFDADNNNKTLSVKQDFSSKNLSELNETLNTYFEELKNISPDAYNSFSLGEFKADAWAEVNAQGIGLGYGVTDHFTVYGSLPFYHMKTNVQFYQSKQSNLSQIKNTVLNTPTTSATSTFIKQLTLQLPETNEQLLQSVLVNQFGYKPLGLWEKDGIGDAEIGMIYRLTDFSDMGSALSLGAVLPTGTPDDPSSIQDISTGDGQLDVYVETLNGISFYNKVLEIDLKLRYTHQIGANQTVRLYDNPEFPLGSEEVNVYQKLGDKIDGSLKTTVNPNHWFNFNLAYLYNRVGQTYYQIENQKQKAALEANTNSINHWAKIGVGFNTVNAYKAKKFDVPFEINLYAQKLINAVNTADYQRFDLEFRLYF